MSKEERDSKFEDLVAVHEKRYGSMDKLEVSAAKSWFLDGVIYELERKRGILQATKDKISDSQKARYAKMKGQTVDKKGKEL